MVGAINFINDIQFICKNQNSCKVCILFDGCRYNKGLADVSGLSQEEIRDFVAKVTAEAERIRNEQN